MQISERNLEVRNLIGGAWEERDGRETEPVYDPATGEVIAETPLSTAEDVDRAVKKAREAFPGWSSTPVVERARILFRFKALLEEHFEELRDLVTLENGKDAKDAGGEVRRGIEVVEFACGMPTLMMGETVRDVARGIDNASYRYPLGVVAAITPFNFPCMVPLWTLPVAIGAGNTYILKPSERTPISAVRLGELLQEAGLPDGVFNIISSAYGNAGERCLAGSVLVAVGDVADPLVEALKEGAQSMKVGPGYHEDSELTPVIRDSHRDKVRGYVDLGEEEGAEVVLDGREPPLEEGFFMGPTILDKVTGEMRVGREEIFGPVLSVVAVS